MKSQDTKSWKFPYTPVSPAPFIDKKVVQKDCYSQKVDGTA